MRPLAFIAFPLLPFVSTTPITLTPPQAPDLTTLSPTFDPLTTNTTNPGVEIGCFRPSRFHPILPTQKPDCEAALDDWVRGQSLTQARTFSRNPARILTTDDVLLPVGKVSGSCSVFVSMVDEGDVDTLTLAEIYAELLGPDGVMKRCLGQVMMPAIGGRVVVGRKGQLTVVVSGWQG